MLNATKTRKLEDYINQEVTAANKAGKRICVIYTESFSKELQKSLEAGGKQILTPKYGTYLICW